MVAADAGRARYNRAMPKKGEPREGYVIEHPNREKAGSKATKAIVVLLLLVSAGLVLVVTVGGWDTLEGAKAVQIAFIVLYVLFAFLIARWNRGLLPVTAAFSVILLIFAAVSFGAWFDRDKDGFSDPTLDEDILGLLSLLLVPIQILLIAFGMRGFQQGSNVEVERSRDDRGERGGGEPAPAAA